MMMNGGRLQGKHMRMDATAVRALNILKQKMDPNDSFSLYGLMNKVQRRTLVFE